MLLKWCLFHWAAKPRTLTSAIPSFFTCYFVIFCTLFFFFLGKGRRKHPGCGVELFTRCHPDFCAEGKPKCQAGISLLWLRAESCQFGYQHCSGFTICPNTRFHQTVIRWLLTDWRPGFELNHDSCRWNRPANVSEVLKCLCDLLHLGQSLVLGTVELRLPN